jgi:hypothetical protein
MQIDHTQEWLRLTEEYRAKGDEELRELYRDFEDLTDVAQQVLAAELRSRGLNQKIAEVQQTPASNNSPWAKRDISPFDQRADIALQGRIPLGSILGNNTMAPVPDEVESDSESDEPVEYTWKTVLCEGVEYDRAWQIQEVLRRAGIESWIERAGGGRASRFANEFDGDLRVKVAADELDRAQAIIANPIPQDIVDESHETAPEYEPPRCPSCGAEDPVLESAEPVNAWKCEICGREWTDPASESQPAGPFN